MKPFSKTKIALVHDHLTQDGGAEKVLRAFCSIFPKSPIFTLVYNEKKMHKVFPKEKIKTSFIQNIPFGLKKYQWFLPLMPSAIEKYDLTDYDIVLSSSSALAKGIITNTNTLHICYCHTPTRYLWSDTHSYVRDLKYNSLIKKIVPIFLTKLRTWDRLSSERVDKFIANSENVKERIQKYYFKTSNVIYPPIETNKFYISEKVGNYYLIGGRLVSYKRYDLAVEAFNRLGIPLKIFGAGPEYRNLKKTAKKNIEFVGQVNDKDLAKLYSKCIAFIHPQEEDFGITPVECMASGRPVIAFNKGGAKETVKEGLSGTFFNEQVWEDLGDKIIRFKPEDFDAKKIREYALNFDIEKFKKEIEEYIKIKWEKFNSK